MATKNQQSSLSPSTTSTISLHIAAYETDDAEEAGNDKIPDHEKYAEMLKGIKQCFTVDSFEFPRQNDESEQQPEASKFNVFQKILKSDKAKSPANSNNQQPTQSSSNTTTTTQSTSNTSSNASTGGTSDDGKPKKSGWKRFIAKFSRKKKKPSAEVATTQSAFDLPPESDGPGGGSCVRKKYPRKNSNVNTEAPVEANASWKTARRTRSMEVSVSGKSSKKVRGKRGQRPRNKRPSKEVIEEKAPAAKTCEEAPTQTQEQTQEVTVVDASTKGSSPKRPSREEDELDQSRKTSRKKSPTKNAVNTNNPGDPLSISKSVSRGFRNFRDSRTKNFRSVKTFISRKVQDKDVEKVVAQVEARKKLRTEPSQDSAGNIPKLHSGDDIFPQRRPNRNKSTKDSKIEKPKLIKASPKPPPPDQTPTMNADGVILIDTNNINDGQLFLSNGRPFWQQQGKGKPGDLEEDDEDITDDELPMNAAIITEVQKGNIKLTDMPSTPVILEPYSSMEALEGHDSVFFNRDIIFSNTVRSMIILGEEGVDHHAKKSVERKCKFNIPDAIQRYSRAQPDEFKSEHFVPKND